MRVMVLVKANEDSEAGQMPSEEALEAMGKFNEELVNAGVMLAGDGLHPSSKGVRVAFDGPEPSVIDGPFAETKELLAGYWMLEVKDMQEAIEWIKRVPVEEQDRGAQIEIRPVYEMSDFEEIAPDAVAQGEELRRRLEDQS